MPTHFVYPRQCSSIEKTIAFDSCDMTTLSVTLYPIHCSDQFQFHLCTQLLCIEPTCIHGTSTIMLYVLWNLDSLSQLVLFHNSFQNCLCAIVLCIYWLPVVFLECRVSQLNQQFLKWCSAGVLWQQYCLMFNFSVSHSKLILLTGDRDFRYARMQSTSHVTSVFSRAGCILILYTGLRKLMRQCCSCKV